MTEGRHWDQMEFRVLGVVEVVDGGATLPLGGPKPRALLAHLISEAGRAIPRERLVDELWGDDPPPTAQDSLHVHLAGLRRILGPRLRTEPNGYCLDAATEEIDSHRFEATVADARALRDDPPASVERLDVALQLWRGPAFGGIPLGPTAAAAAARLEELRLAVLEERIEACLAGGRHADVVAELTGLVVANPARERLSGQLMLALHRSGRGPDALVVYETLCRVLDEQLGVDPGDAITALSRAIRRDDPTLAAPGPASLPVSASRFVGRDLELARAGELLAAGRLLTLTGPGGSGKTRLAIALARTAAATHPEGVHLIDLAVVTPSTSVTREVATRLGVRERGNQSLPALLTAWAKHRRCLLLLDNCDHVVADCAELCTQLLESAPGLRILATSREVLGIPGEVVFAITGLHLPESTSDVESIAASESVRLFVDRATAVRPDFALAPGDAAVMATICRHLDGLPLAIELAASRLGGISLGELAEWLATRLDALGGSRAIHARHRTMTTAIEWSYDLLSPIEQAAFRRLSVFAGGLTAETAQAVVSGWEPVAADVEMRELCQRLASKSMLVAMPGPERTRYRMLEVVRQFAARRLVDAEEESAARTRHASWYDDFIPNAPTWAGPEQGVWIKRLQWDVVNVRAALSWYLGEGWRPNRALSMVGRLWWFWYLQGLLGEGRGWFRRALAAAPDDVSAERGLALRGAAATARIMGDFTDAIDLGNAALAVFRSLDDQRGIAASLNNLCISAMSMGEMTVARRHAEDSLEVAARLDDTQGVANSTNNLGIIVRNLGDIEAAAQLFTRAREMYGANDNRRGLAAALSNLAILHQGRGDSQTAHPFAIEALQMYAELDFDEGMLDCLGVLAALDAVNDRATRALRTLGVIARRRDELGAPLTIPDEIQLCATAETLARAALRGPDAELTAQDSAHISVSDIAAEYLSPATAGAGAGA